MSVCKLLAIDPNDVLLRDISEFNMPGFSEKRIQYRYEYYEEKRQLKLKAIENVLIKLAQGRSGAAQNPEAQQVTTLLEDVRNSSLTTPLKFDAFGEPISMRSKSAAQTVNFGRPGRSQLGARQPVGYILNRNESHLRYLPKHVSPEGFRAKRVLNRMPKNLISQENQDSLKYLMNDYFVAPMSYGSRLYDGDSQKTAQSLRGHSRSQVPAQFDSFSLGFELPASTQLSRMNAKLGRWDRAQEMLGQR